MDVSTKSIVCTTLDENGSIVRKDNLENSFDKLGEFLDSFSPGDSFVMESTGFYEPLYDFIESRGFSVKLVNPLKIKLIAESRMKNDDVDSEILAKLLRNDWIPESYVPPKEIREIRRIVRRRIQISQTMRSYKNRIRYELLRMHVDYEVDPFTNKGKIFLWNLHNPRVDSYVNVLNGLEKEVHKTDESIARYGNLEDVKLLMTIPGIGLFSAVLIHSEIGYIKRFPDSSKLMAYTGMIRSVRQSADVVHYGHITYQGSKYLRWIITEALHVPVCRDSIAVFQRERRNLRHLSRQPTSS